MAGWRVRYDLVYEGGVFTEWTRSYRTRPGATISRLRHLYLSSWGGTAVIVKRGPMKLWTSCTMEPEGTVKAEGVGYVAPGTRFEIEANGLTIEMVCTTIQSPGPVWEAVDLLTYERAYRWSETLV